MIDWLLVNDKWATLQLYSRRGQSYIQYTRNKNGNEMTLCFLVTRTRGDLRYTLNMLFWKWEQTTTRSICVVLSKVDRGVPLVEHEPLTFPWHFWVGFVLYFIGFLCSILSTIIYHFSFCHCIDIHITASDNPFSIFKRFSVKQQSTGNMSLQSDTICWLCAMQSLILLLNHASLSEKQQKRPMI
jgi:hypothetical protein